jgi:hypothetical protein
MGAEASGLTRPPSALGLRPTTTYLQKKNVEKYNNTGNGADGS